MKKMLICMHFYHSILYFIDTLVFHAVLKGTFPLSEIKLGSKQTVTEKEKKASTNGRGDSLRSNNRTPDLATQRGRSLLLWPERHFSPGFALSRRRNFRARPFACLPSMQAVQGQAPARHKFDILRVLWQTTEQRCSSPANQVYVHFWLPLVSPVSRLRWIG